MNNKGFVLMETIVVIVVISVALLTIFRSYNKILSKVKTENKYDTSEYIYMTKYIEDYLKDCAISQEITTSNLKNYYTDTTCSLSLQPGINKYNIKKIHILKNINSESDDKFKKFDAYMIDYIKKLDVGDKDEIIIVEYQRRALDDKGIEKFDSKGKELYETYIASLEWN